MGNISKADGNVVKRWIAERGVEKSFILFEQFVPDDVFYSYIRQSDYILPLINPLNSELKKYLTEKISGSYNLAIAHRIPMLCPDTMQVYADFADTACFYPANHLMEFTYSLPLKGTKTLFQSDKWSEEYQREKLPI